MKSWQRWLAALLCLAMLAGVSGCFPGLPALLLWSELRGDESSSASGSLPQPAFAETPQTSQQTTAAKSGYFGGLKRADVAYADMKPDAPTSEEMQKLADAVERFAKAGGEQTAFDDAAWDAEYALRRCDTAAGLYELQNSADPGDKKLAAKISDADRLYDEAGDEFWTAMHDVAVSPHADLLKSAYTDDQIKQFQNYGGGSTDDSQALSDQETALERQYETLISAQTVDYDQICELFVKLVGVRNQIAAQAGCDSFAAYAYDSLYCRSYKPSDAQKIWQAARETVSPLVTEYDAEISQKMGELPTSSLDGSQKAVVAAIQTGADGISPEVSQAAQYLQQYGLCDIEAADGKLSTGYTTFLSEYNEPFIFNAPSGGYSDYTDLFHEFGHFLAYFYNGSDILFGVSDYDLSELQSQGMEVMFLPYYENIFGQTSAKTVRAGTLLNLLYSVLDGAMYDEFQQRVYAEKNLTAARVKDIFKEVYTDYGYEPYKGFQQEWMDQIHNFEQPFYYISYAVSAIPALELFTLQTKDRAKAADAYLQIAAMSDEDYYLQDAVKQAGLGGAFDEKSCQTIADTLQQSGALEP
jgi:oligoendopeptidase F